MLKVVASAIFSFVISMGSSYAPASAARALASGMVPFWTALFTALLIKENLRRLLLTGLVFIFMGDLFCIFLEKWPKLH